MKKITKVFLIVAVALIIVGTVGFTVIMSVNNWDFLILSSPDYETKEYEFEGIINNIEIKTNTSDIIFKKATDAKCKVICSENKKSIKNVSFVDGELLITENESKKWYDYIEFLPQKETVTVYIPSDNNCSLNIANTTGDVSCGNDICFENVCVNSSTGNLYCNSNVIKKLSYISTTGHSKIENASIGEIEIKVTTGEVKIKNLSCNGDTKIKATTADVEIENMIGKSFSSVGTTGEIKLENTVISGDADIERSTGDIELEGFDAENIKIKTLTGNVEGTVLSDKIFLTESSTGSVNVPKTTSGGKCEITTKTGNIKIKIE